MTRGRSTPVSFDNAALVDFRAAYPDRPMRLRHRLADHPLLKLSALAGLAERMPPTAVEYNRGDLPLSLRPEDTPANGLSLAETIRTIDTNGSWAVLKNVERDPAYAALLDRALAPLVPLVGAATGSMLRCEAFLFLSSPGSVTPFHMDPEHNILLQIAGKKMVALFPTRDEETVPPEMSEAFARGGHRNLVWNDRFLDRATQVHLNPGDAVYVPVKAPHFVRNGDAVSVSFSITWRSRRSIAEAELHSLNAWLRARALPLVAVSARPERQWIGRGLYRIADRIGW